MWVKTGAIVFPHQILITPLYADGLGQGSHKPGPAQPGQSCLEETFWVSPFESGIPVHMVWRILTNRPPHLYTFLFIFCLVLFLFSFVACFNTLLGLLNIWTNHNDNAIIKPQSICPSFASNFQKQKQHTGLSQTGSKLNISKANSMLLIQFKRLKSPGLIMVLWFHFWFWFYWIWVLTPKPNLSLSSKIVSLSHFIPLPCPSKSFWQFTLKKYIKMVKHTKV